MSEDWINQSVAKAADHIVNERNSDMLHTVACETIDLVIDEVLARHAPAHKDESGLREALEEMIGWAERETEYDGRTYTICQSCDGQDGHHHDNCALPKYRALLAALSVSGVSGENSSAENAQPSTSDLSGEKGARDTWLLVRDPGCVPERKGPFAAKEVGAFIRELMYARPYSYIEVVRVFGGNQIDVQDGPECLEMCDGRSQRTAKKHTARLRANSVVLRERNPALGAPKTEEVEEAITALSAAPQAPAGVGDDWLPIETAPKDRIVLLWAVTDTDDNGNTRNWKMATGCRMSRPPLDETYTEFDWDGCRLKVYDHQPTHWRPLPEPPAALQAPAGEKES